MKGSIIIVSFFVAGLLLSRFGIIPEGLIGPDHTRYALYFLMFLVGISIGSDRKVLDALKQQNWRMITVPAGTIVGTLAGSAVIAFFIQDMKVSDSLAIGSGFGYYSLSSIFITQYRGAELGTIALTTNIIREIITLLFAPLMVKYFGKLAPISSGGATTMDTTLPIITRCSGKEYVVVAVFHGIVVDFTVPFLVTFFATL